MGKTEGRSKEWHAHVTALTIAPEYRRLGLARKMMDDFESVGDSENCHFVDLFVRPSNVLAVKLYRNLGYSVYRTVRGYYSGSKGAEENAWDMRKPLKSDKWKQSVRQDGEKVIVEPEDTYF
ncbi:N-terminal acetyltransferase B complex catalytic subunit naa20 [Neolecta irregularis DAH-3]|uniref:N-terminal acetyltransferase B complex catalytic subunit naa20 n=1 Tax=Neolecta irregularis (strain DAH-3) TaxID=1198029 RepID=A0A1U7LRB3_NEOID|nr:N-terminal acetyltransferase B complex catalytic subunit naa20 [Neolecta irregularis DAH-3]|eukprot:OLL25197.1 N-terminal acetyltransferase B complex catalytic subunit naa20 [Neolecta irregularis DAH-3]